jgi:ribonucleoside-diphosphate reductase alpha chain
MNAGVGMIGVATVMARAGVKYGSLEGRNLLHKLSERHMYFMIKASLQLGREKGNAPWMHKTKWPEGWLPIDTYNRSINEIVTEPYHYPWEELRADVVENGGIRNSCLVAHMPTESSSKASPEWTVPDSRLVAAENGPGTCCRLGSNRW